MCLERSLRAGGRVWRSCSSSLVVQGRSQGVEGDAAWSDLRLRTRWGAAIFRRSRRFREIFTDAGILLSVELQVFMRAVEPGQAAFAAGPPVGSVWVVPAVLAGGWLFLEVKVYLERSWRGGSVLGLVERHPAARAAEQQPGSGR